MTTAARAIAGHLDGGADVVVLCEGDPFFYGSSCTCSPGWRRAMPVEVVPGVSSLGACAAALGRPLVARNGVLSVLPGPLPDAELADAHRAPPTRSRSSRSAGTWRGCGR